jgi:hypothetical protein
LETYIYDYRDAFIAASVPNQQQAEEVVPIITRFISGCSVEQIWLAPEKCTRFFVLNKLDSNLASLSFFTIYAQNHVFTILP